MFSSSVGKEDAVQLLVPQDISLNDLIIQMAFQEGLLGCSVECLHLTICLGMIGAGNVVPDVCEHIELVSNLIIQQKKEKQK